MFSKVFLLASLMCVNAASSTVLGTLQTRFRDWVTRHEIHFINNARELRAFENWVENDRHIDMVNAKNMTYTLGHNQFSGMDITEFALYLGLDATASARTVNLRGPALYLNEIKVASSVDWVESGAVTPVKNQGQCGSCWSFSTTGALEGAYFVKYGTLKSFSEQQLVSCDNRQHGGKDMGCNGGLMDNAFTWIKNNGGLCSESDYPYTSGTTTSAGTCETTCANVANSMIHSFADVPVKSDDDMMAALNVQPVSIAIEADQKDFQLYKSGVFTGDCGTSLDHGVLVVGYGNKDGEDYYRVKNSWGTTWGDAGYIYLGRGKQYNNGSGQCGMLLQASYPIM